MSRMSDLHQEIYMSILEGELTFEQIARAYGVSIQVVSEIARQILVDNQHQPVV